MTYRDISINGGEPRSLGLTRGGVRSRVLIGSKAFEAASTRVGQDWEMDVDGLSARVSIVVDKDLVQIHAFGRTWRVTVTDPAERALRSGDQSDISRAPMPGVAISVMVSPGQEVVAGQPMVLIESMKMQTEISAGRAGTVDLVHARVGESFPLGAPLVTLVPLAQETV